MAMTTVMVIQAALWSGGGGLLRRGVFGNRRRPERDHGQEAVSGGRSIRCPSHKRLLAGVVRLRGPIRPHAATLKAWLTPLDAPRPHERGSAFASNEANAIALSGGFYSFRQHHR